MSGSMQSPGRFKAFCPALRMLRRSDPPVFGVVWTADRRQQMSTLFKNPPGIFAEYENLKSPAPDTLRTTTWSS